MALQSYSIRPMLRADKVNARGLCPLVIRVIINRKTIYHTLPTRLQLSDWDDSMGRVKTKVSGALLLNMNIQKLVNAATDYLLAANLAGKTVTAKQVVESLGNIGVKDDLLAYWRKLLLQLRGLQHINTLRLFKIDYEKVYSFRSNLTFGDVTPEFLRQFDQHLIIKHKNSQNTRWRVFKHLKKIFNLARKDKVTNLYPFKEYNVPKYVQGLRTNLTIQEVDKVEQLVIKGVLPKNLWVAANYFLLACYTGLRYQDLRKFDPLAHMDDRLVVATMKTGEVVSIKRHARLNVILERLTSQSGLVSNQKINEYLKIIGKMAGIRKHLTCHVGRHTFAVINASLGIPSDVVQKLLGHTNIKTTHIYYKISNTDIDAQMDKWDSLGSDKTIE